MKLSDLTSTHPPISERIRILRNMTHGASFQNYSASYSDTTGRKTIVPPAALTEKEDIELRQAAAETKKKPQQKNQLHQVGDIMRRVNGFLFLSCACGLKMKVPPNFKAAGVTCPKCGKILQLPKK